mmetsp:Transcript_7278/g.21482  ORF Transcript_7278/g.21482 Transcript_7278/m.21482 type:complete len:273 (+) Transcript_7278:1392-2210(+)
MRLVYSARRLPWPRGCTASTDTSTRSAARPPTPAGSARSSGRSNTCSSASRPAASRSTGATCAARSGISPHISPTSRPYLPISPQVQPARPGVAQLPLPRTIRRTDHDARAALHGALCEHRPGQVRRHHRRGRPPRLEHRPGRGAGHLPSRVRQRKELRGAPRIPRDAPRVGGDDQGRAAPAPARASCEPARQAVCIASVSACTVPRYAQYPGTYRVCTLSFAQRGVVRRALLLVTGLPRTRPPAPAAQSYAAAAAQRASGVWRAESGDRGR